MDDEQPTVFAAYGNLLCAQYAFAQRALQANAKLAGLWSGLPRVVDESPSVTAIRPEVMSA